jgi:protein-S-isoprenylcysteine O-methyltransferase Ste14
MMFLRTLPIAIFTLALLLVSAGRWIVPRFFIYTGLMWMAAGLIYTLAPRDLVAERLKPPADRDARSRRVALPLMLLHYVLAGFDVRFGWSSASLGAQAAGLALVAAAMGLVGWTLVENPFASSAVRIQQDRGQRVITTGPYALVRHPMYLGVFLFCVGSGPGLGSWWAALPLVILLPIFVRRTLLEDRMLETELNGYREYAKKVRWRVVPGIF